MSSPFRSQVPQLEARLRDLEIQADALVETAAELERERRLRRRPSQLVFLVALVAFVTSVGGVIAGRASGQASAARRSLEIAERARTRADTARGEKEACQSVRDRDKVNLSACLEASTAVLAGGPAVDARGEHALDERRAFFEVAADVDACAAGAPEPLVAHVTFATSGVPTEVALRAARMTAARRECSEKVIRKARIPAFTGEPVEARATFEPNFVSLHVTATAWH